MDSGSYDFNIFVPLSEYKKYLANSGENTISVTGTLCNSGDCSGTCLGLLTNPHITTIPDCACDYTLNISNYSVTPNTVTIGNSVVVSGSISLTKGQNCFLNGQDIDIYNNGSKVATAVTDAKGNFSTSVSLDTVGTHIIEAKLGNSNVSKKVTVTEAPILVQAAVIYTQFQLGVGSFDIEIISEKQKINLKYNKEINVIFPNDLVAHPAKKIYATYFQAPYTPSEYHYICTLDWAFEPFVEKDIKKQLEKLKKFSGPQIVEIRNQVLGAGIEDLKALILYQANHSLNDDYLQCKNTAIVTHTGNIISRRTTFEKVISFWLH